MNDFIHKLPKVELHVHLEGAIPLPALYELIQKYEGQGEVPDLEALRNKFRYKDFPHFIETWVWKNRFLREYDDFTFIAEKFAESLCQQNIIYSEAFYSPGDFARHGLEPQKLTEAIRKGFDSYRSEVTINLVADLIRDFGPEKGERWLREVNEVRELGVIGIGIGGSEQQFPPEAYSQVYALARSLGFKTSAHAGEAAGPESIWGAIRSLKVDRIGHGTRAIEDPKLVEYLVTNRVAIEMCPISNLRTGIIQSLTEHPIRKFFDLGIPVSVNTDDPEMFNTTLNLEFQELRQQLGFSNEEIETLTRNGIEMAWCSEQVKAELCLRLDKVNSLEL